MRYFRLLPAFLLCVALMLTGCGKQSGEAVLKGTVYALQEQTAIVEVTEADPKESYVSRAEIPVPDELAEKLSVGSQVKITFSGKSDKQNPAQLYDIIRVEVVD